MNRTDQQEPDNEYRFNGGQYVFFLDGKPATKPADTIALFIDAEDGTLHRHGDPTAVRMYHQVTSEKFRSSDSLEVRKWADKLVVVEGRFPLEEINRCLGTTGYAKDFYEKLMAGQISPVATDYVDERGEEKTTSTTMKQDYRLLVCFAEDVTASVKELAKSICHIPKFWDVTVAQREQLTLMSHSAETTGHIVFFKHTLDVGQAEAIAFSKFLEDVAEKCDGKKYILQPGDGSTSVVNCQFALGGYQNEVISRVKEMKQNGQPAPVQTSETSEVLTPFEDTPSC